MPRPAPTYRVITFRSPEDFFECLLGPRQHDQHVVTRHQHLVLEEKREQTARASRELWAEVRAYLATPRHLRRVA